jgi:hypothetical protein
MKATAACPTDDLAGYQHPFARRRAYDWRAALLLIQQGVTEFATVNEKDFRDCGFQRVWNPLAEG